MSESSWQPHVVVAAVICRSVNGEDKFLLVREHTTAGEKINQPAGHWEAGESLNNAVIRETREETGFEFIPRAILGIYIITNQAENITYLRIAFVGDVANKAPLTELDPDIIEAMWLSKEEIISCQSEHRSEFVLQMISDYYQKPHLPLSVINDFRER